MGYLCREGVEDVCCCVRVECLRVLQCCGSVCPATSSSLTRATAGGAVVYNVVDVYNSATGAWSTAQLSVARDSLAAASVGNVALFAGGRAKGGLLCREVVEDVCCCVRVECLRVLQCCGSVCPATSSSLTRATAGGPVVYNVVDVYNSATGAWSTAQLSVARGYLAAASVGNVALFAGGYGANGGLLCRQGGGWRCSWLRGVDCLRVLQCCGSVCPAAASSLTRATADVAVFYNVVDVYNSATGAWSTAQLSVAREGLAAASVGNVALFAGGYTGGGLFVQGGGGRCLLLRAC